MSKRPQDNRPKSLLNAAYPSAGNLSPRHVPGKNNFRRARFGIAMLVISLIPIVAGAYPITIDLSSRLLLMLVGLACAFIGAQQIHRANCEL